MYRFLFSESELWLCPLVSPVRSTRRLVDAFDDHRLDRDHRSILTAPHARRQGGDGRFAPAARAPINLRTLPEGAQLPCAPEGSV